MSKLISLLSILSLLLILLVLSFLLPLFPKKSLEPLPRTETKSLVRDPTSNIEPSITPTPIPWQTYHNEKYQYQLSYPPNWQLTEWDLEKAANLKSPPDGSILQQTILSGKDGHLEVLIWKNQWQLPARRWLSTFRHEDLILKNIPNEENETFHDQPAFRFLQGQTSRNKPIEYIFFKDNSLIFEILMERSYLKLDYPLYEQILSSFQIL